MKKIIFFFIISIYSFFQLSAKIATPKERAQQIKKTKKYNNNTSDKQKIAKQFAHEYYYECLNENSKNFLFNSRDIDCSQYYEQLLNLLLSEHNDNTKEIQEDNQAEDILIQTITMN